MEQVSIPDFVLKRLGLEVVKNQLLEEQVAEKNATIQELSEALEVEGATNDSIGGGEAADPLNLVHSNHAETA